MITLITALLIATSDTTPPCCKPTAIPNSSRTEISHPVGHVVVPMIATTSFYGGALYLGASKKQARIISVSISAALIVLKEVYDHSTAAKNFSGADIALGVVGTGAGLLIAEKITWPEEKKYRSAR